MMTNVNTWAIYQSAKQAARYHKELSQNIYCDSAREHAERAAELYDEARAWLRKARDENENQ